MDMSSVIHFIEQLRDKLELHPDAKLIYSVASCRRSLSNSVFLLGAYMIIMMRKQTAQVLDIFDWLDETDIEPFRDATFAPSTFGLGLEDCWRGLEKSMALAWVRPTTDGALWGNINILEYRHYTTPFNGDFHEVVPGKLIAFPGPKDLAVGEYLDDTRGYRKFSPAFYADVFASDFGVTTVVRLNEAEYEADAFEERGIRHHDLCFDDCTCPPPCIARAFIAAADAAVGGGGAVAVHCKAGLGRTGTLIALYMMRSFGFGAREAMGWQRIMRPGSVIGTQQQFLCAVEARLSLAAEMGIVSVDGTGLMCRWANTSRGRLLEEDESGNDSDWHLDAGGADAAKELAAEVAAGMERRGAARMKRSQSES